MNIILATHEYPPDTNFGGIATYMNALANELANQGHTVHVISRSINSFSTISVLDGVIIHRIAYPQGWNGLPLSIFNELYSDLVCTRINELNQFCSIDLIETTEYGSELIRYTGDIPVVILLVTSTQTVKESNRLEQIYPLQKQELYQVATVTHQERFQTSQADAIIAPSKYMRDLIVSKWGIDKEKISVIPLSIRESSNLVDSNKKLPLLQSKQLRILFYGRIEPRKGPQTFLTAIPNILSNYPDSMFILFGRDTVYGPNGSSYLHYLLRSKNLNIDYKHVRFINNWESEEIKLKHIDLADVVVIPSLHESFGLVPLEALFRGKVIVISDKMGITEYIHHLKNVFVFHAEDPLDLARKVNEALALKNYDINGIQTQLDELSRQFGISTVISRVMSLYQTLVKNKIKSKSSAQSSFTPLISIMIIAYNELQYTKALIKSIRENTHYPYIINILDNGSTDDTRNWLISIQHDNDINVLISDTNEGCAGGRNILIKKGHPGDFVLFIDNDCILGEDWDFDLIQFFKNDLLVGVVGQSGYYINVNENEREVTPVKEFGKADIITGYFMLMRYSLINLLGDFDNEIASFWHEDDDYCIRAAHAGFTNLMVPVKVIHFGHKSSTAAGIEQSTLSEISISRRRYLVNKWIEMGAIENGKIIVEPNSFKVLSNMISKLMSNTSLYELGIYEVRSLIDTLLHSNFPWDMSTLTLFLNYLISKEQHDFNRYFLFKLLFPIKIKKIQYEQHAQLLVFYGQFSYILNDIEETIRSIHLALNVDPTCQEALELKNKLEKDLIN